MGYFDDYLQKNQKKNIEINEDKLQTELNAYGHSTVTADVSANKYGYQAADVINVAKLLHEANVRKLDVKTKMDSSPLLYRKETDALGNVKKIKRGHFEKKKLLKDAEAYEEKIKNTDYAVAEVDANAIPVEEPVEEITEMNATYMDENTIAVSEEEFPEQTDNKKLTLNKRDQVYLASQKENLSVMDKTYLSRLKPELIKALDDPDLEPAFKAEEYEINDNLSDEQMTEVLEFVRDNIIDGSAIRMYRTAFSGSSFVKTDDMYDLIDDVIKMGVDKIKQSKWEELAFKFRLFAIYCAGINLGGVDSAGKTILQLSRVFTNRASS